MARAQILKKIKPHYASSALAIGLLSVGLEYYDLFLDDDLEPIIHELFFPIETGLGGLLGTLWIFTTNFAGRIIGGAIFGHFGDTDYRGKSLGKIYWAIALPALVMAICPSYATIGFLASIVIFLAQSVGVAAIGGNLAGGSLYVIENYVSKYRGLLSSSLSAAAAIFIAIFSIFELVSVSLFSHPIWWRLMYFSVFVCGMTGATVVAKHHSQNANGPAERTKNRLPIFSLIFDNYKVLLKITSTSVFSNAISGIVFNYFPQTLAKSVGVTMNAAIWINVGSLAIFALFSICSGWLSDQIGRKPILLACALIFSTASIFVFYSIYHYGESFYLPGQFLLSAISAMQFGVSIVAFIEALPRHIRFSGIGIGYNLGFCISNCLSLIIFSSENSIEQWAKPVLLIFIAAAIGISAIWNFPDSKKFARAESL